MPNLAPSAKFQAFDSNGDPLVAGLLYTYVSGGSTPLATYTDAGGLTSNNNPVVLNARGEADVWLSALYTYRFTLATAAAVPIWTVDGIVGAPSTANIQNGAFTLLSNVAGTNTITATVSPTLTAYANGQLFQLIPANLNTGATTLNVDGVGAKNVFTQGQACTGGELRASVPVLVQYDGSRFNIIGPFIAAWTSYTPTVTLVGGSGNTVPVYTTNTGRYRKVGRGVEGDVLLSGDGGAEGAGSGAINIALPYVSGANSPTGYVPMGTALNNATNYIVVGTLGASSATVKLNVYTAATVQSDLTGDLQNNATRQIRISFRYETD